jgi:ferredoxin
MEDPMPSIDDDTCIECGICSDILPQYFEVSGGRVRVRPEVPSGSLDAEALAAAARDCPSLSIRVRER